VNFLVGDLCASEDDGDGLTEEVVEGEADGAGEDDPCD